MKRKLQIFITSAGRGLEAEQQAAVEAILKAGDLPAGLLPLPADESQRQAMQRWLEGADAQIFLLGADCGPLDPRTGKPLAEQALELADARKKPCVALVLSEGRLQEARLLAPPAPAAQLAAYQALRERLMATDGVAFFADARDVKLSILESLGEWKQTRAFSGWIAGREVIETAPLVAEIGRLSAENQQLRAQLSALEERVARRAEGPSLDGVVSALQATKLTIPATATGGGKHLNITLAAALFAFGEVLISGVSNGYAMNEQQKYLFFNLLPKLAMHDLAEKRKVPGKAYEQFELNKLGLEVLKRLQALELEGRQSRRVEVSAPPEMPPAPPPDERPIARARASSRAGMSRAGQKKS